MIKRDTKGKYKFNPKRRTIRLAAIAEGNIFYSWNCKKCKLETDFYVSDDRCKLCKFKYNNLPRVYKRQRTAEMLKDYGITPKDWLRMYKEQDGKCLTCDTTFHNKWEKQTAGGLHVDHCHITKKVRGLLCAVCNKLAGQIEKDRERLHKIINHIDYHSEPGRALYHVGYESFGKILSRTQSQQDNSIWKLEKMREAS